MAKFLEKINSRKQGVSGSEGACWRDDDDELGWKPIAPGFWRNAEHTAEALLSAKPYEIAEIARAVAESAEEEQWRKASKHHLGMGLEKGPPSMQPAERARKKLISQNDWEKVAALDAVICGGAVHSDRLGESICCFRCGQPDSAWHRYWSCEKI